MLPYKWKRMWNCWGVRQKFQVIINLVDMQSAEVDIENPIAHPNPLRHSVSQESLFPLYKL